MIKESLVPSDSVPSAKSMSRMERYVEKYREKSGTCGHPETEVTAAVVLGLAQHIDELEGHFARAIFIRTRRRSLKKVVVGCVPAMK